MPVKQAPPIEKSAEQSDPQPDPDPEHPVSNPHASHEWNPDQVYFLECQRCGTRDHWPAARLSCVKTPSSRAEPVTLASAVRLLYLDLDAFAVHWLARVDVLGPARPTLNEWRAEFLEWSKGARPERE